RVLFRSQEYIVHLQRFFEDYARSSPQWLAPPGYLSIEQLKIRAAGADKMHGGFDFKAISGSFFIAVGTPEKVANQIGEWTTRMGTNHINILMHVWDMPQWKAVKNTALCSDYVMHYLELFDALKIGTMNLIGISMGGYLAAKFASEHGHRINKLVLIAPYGLEVPEHPAVDIIAMPGEEIVPMLVSNFDALKK